MTPTRATRTIQPLFLGALATAGLGLAMAGLPSPAAAATIDFDSIQTTTTFVDGGLSSYLDYSWSSGWGSNYLGDPLVSSPVLGVSGETSAANSGGEQGLVVGFGTPTDVTGVFLRQLDIDGSPAETIQLIGRDASGAVVESSEVRPVAPTWRFFAAGFEAVDSLEIRAGEPSTFFGVDNLIVDADALDLIGAAADLVFVLTDEGFIRGDGRQLLRLLERAEQLVEAGHGHAARRLLRVVQNRSDGCVERGRPDRRPRRPDGVRTLRGRGVRTVPDALADCVDQVDLHTLLEEAIEQLPRRSRPER